MKSIYTSVLGCVIVSSFMLGCNPCFAQDIQRAGTETVKATPATGSVEYQKSDKMVAEDLNEYPDTSIGVNLVGITLFGASTIDPAKPPVLTGVHIMDGEVLYEKELQRKLQKYLGQPLSPRLAERVRREVYGVFRLHGYYATVQFPQQDATGGVVQLQIMMPILDQVTVTGNKRHSDEKYVRHFEDDKGEPITSYTLMERNRGLNTSPFRSVDTQLSLGDPVGNITPVEAQLKVVERFPLAVAIGFDNELPDLLGRERYSLEVTGGDLLGWDHLASYRWTTPYDLDQQGTHAFTYVMPSPFSFRHQLALSGFYSWTEVDIPMQGDILHNKGESMQGTISYSIPFTVLTPWLAETVSFGFDAKATDNTFDYAGQRFSETGAETYQFWIAHNASWSGGPSQALRSVSFGNRLVVSPGNLTDRNDDAVFNELRPGASSDYFYWQVNASAVLALPSSWVSILPDKMQKGMSDMLLVASVDGMNSTQNLLPAEALSLGGFTSVRGFEENALQVDHGYILRAELYGPAVSVMEPLVRKFTGKVPGKDQLRMYGFVDYGAGASTEQLENEPDEFALFSAGVGLNYSFGTKVSINTGYGWQIEQKNYNDSEQGRFHIQARFQWQ